MLRDFRVDLTVTYLSVRKAIATKGFCRVGVRFVETWTCSVRVVSLFVKIIFELLNRDINQNQEGIGLEPNKLALTLSNLALLALL